jgi:hypothetical protein
MEFMLWLEQTSLGTFVRESPSYLGFPGFLFAHTLGLSLVVGPAVVIGIRILGMAPAIPLKPLVRLFPFMWVGFAITVMSGVGLAVADASNKLLNPILLTKLVLILFATINLWFLKKRVFDRADVGEVVDKQGRILAGSLMSLWLLVTIAGRLIAYWRAIFDV